jgi:hypothetical protein
MAADKIKSRFLQWNISFKNNGKNWKIQGKTGRGDFGP